MYVSSVNSKLATSLFPFIYIFCKTHWILKNAKRVDLIFFAKYNIVIIV